jgi:hypothetical protein
MDVDNKHFIFIRANTIFLFFLPLILFESGYGLKKVKLLVYAASYAVKLLVY